MSDDAETALLEHLDKTPSGAGGFEALSDGLRADYDTLRDAVFKLLSSKPPKLEQIFDSGIGSMVLRRPT